MSNLHRISLSCMVALALAALPGCAPSEGGEEGSIVPVQIVHADLTPASHRLVVDMFDAPGSMQHEVVNRYLTDGSGKAGIYTDGADWMVVRVCDRGDFDFPTSGAGFEYYEDHLLLCNRDNPRIILSERFPAP